MFLAILLTAFVCSLLFAVYTENAAHRRADNKCEVLRNENKKLRIKNDEYRDYEVKRLCRDNYRRGLEDGSKCDTLYKSIVSKYNAHEQISVMMYGETGGDEQ